MSISLSIKKGVVSYYEKAYSIQVNVAFPEQDIASGVIQLVVTQDKAIPAKSFETVAHAAPAAEEVAEETRKPFSSSVDKSFLAKASPVTGRYAAASEARPYRYDTYTTNNVQTPRLRGLLLVSNEKELHLDGYELVQGLELVSVVMPGEPEHFQGVVTERCINRPLTQETITDIKRTIIRYYQDLNRPVVTVVIPEQDVTAGVLQIIVIKGRVGRIYATGNKWFTEEQLVKHISLRPDQVIDSEVLDDDLFLLNRNPFRQVDLIYTPGAELGYTDLELLTYDRFPLKVYAGVDNTGNDLTGNNRIFAGINLGKIIAADQTLSYQYITSSDFHRFKAHTIHYSAPLPWKHTLVLFGGYSRVTNEFHITPISTQRFHSHGFASQASLRYDIPLDPHPNLLHEFTLGFDFKRTNNNLELGAAPIVSKRVNIGQFMASYNLGYEKNPFTFTFEIEGFGSPGQWIGDQKDVDYQSLRPFATAAYFYGRASITFLWEFLYKASAQFYLRGQYANRNLLQSEEYGVGGYSTVRGYKERYINGDNAAVGNFELRMPPFSILQLFGARNGRDELQFLAFFDFGWAAVHKPVTDQHRNHHIYSVGPGLRYLVAPFITLKVDWGFQLHEISKDDPPRDNRGGPSNRVHFSLVVGY